MWTICSLQLNPLLIPVQAFYSMVSQTFSPPLRAIDSGSPTLDHNSLNPKQKKSLGIWVTNHSDRSGFHCALCRR